MSSGALTMTGSGALGLAVTAREGGAIDFSSGGPSMRDILYKRDRPVDDLFLNNLKPMFMQRDDGDSKDSVLLADEEDDEVVEHDLDI